MKIATEEQLMYFTNLICETLPDSYKRDDYIRDLGLSTNGQFIVLQIVLSNTFKAIINYQPENSLSNWKFNFHQLILEEFSTDTLSSIALLNLQPFTRTLIIQMASDLSIDDIYSNLKNAFLKLVNRLNEDYDISIIGCFGDIKSQLLSIGSSYKNAYQLQEYTYIIGLSECAFFDTAGITTDHSLVEYKYIHLFEELFANKDWINICQLLTRIKAGLIDHFINNSKTTYLYKEIYGITIRHLFDEMALYKSEIQMLNEGINLYDHLFDDIHSVHNNYLSILKNITHIETNHCHPSIQKAIKIIHSEYMQQLSLIYLSESLMLSTAYFSRLFKEEMGMNFKEYLTSYRIDIAKTKLLDTSKDIGQIAKSIGYTTASQMVRVFKTIEGMTPTAYRQLKKQ